MPDYCPDAGGAETQHADDVSVGYAAIAHEQNIGCGFLPASARIARQSVKTANGLALTTIRPPRQSLHGQFLVTAGVPPSTLANVTFTVDIAFLTLEDQCPPLGAGTSTKLSASASFG